MKEIQVAHVLRKYNPQEWGGTESYIVRLFGTLKKHGVESTFFCPRTTLTSEDSQLEQNHRVVRFNACVPVWGINAAQKDLLVSVGGNILSFDLPWKLWKQPQVDIITTHALGRLGATALKVAKARGVPLIATIHGGYLDLPLGAQESFVEPLKGGFEWGKMVGALIGARNVVENADAVVVVSPKEQELLQTKYPGLRVECVPPVIDESHFQSDCKEAAFAKWPQLKGKKVVLCVARIDPPKNQLWLINQVSAVVRKFPDAIFVFVGKHTSEEYYQRILREIQENDLTQHVLLTGNIANEDPLLAGLMQLSEAVVLPSISETFGIALAEAQMVGKPVLSSFTSGPTSYIEHEKTGFLFDLEDPQSFRHYLAKLFEDREFAQRMGQEAKIKAKEKFNLSKAAGKMTHLYESLIEEKHALRRNS